MRRSVLLLTVLALLLGIIDGAGAAAPGTIAEVTFPPLSAKGNMDFWEIPWSPGNKLTGSFAVKVNSRVKNLTVRAVTGGTSLDYASRNTIAKQYIRFSLPDSTVPIDPTQTPAAAPQTYEPGTYLFTFDVENIPAEDTYVVQVEVAGEVQDAAAGTYVPFVERLPDLKLKAFAEPAISILSGSQLTAQWVNQNAPWSLLRPLENLLDRSEEAFLRRANPRLTVSLTMPGRPHVDTTQTFDVQVSLDPVLDENGDESPDVFFDAEVLNQKDGSQGSEQQPVAGLRKETIGVPGNETLLIHIGRRYAVDPDGKVSSTRIPPGVYKSTLHVETAWGTKYDLPVEIRVRDNPLFAALALVAGIMVSLLAAYWQTRQPLFQAQVKARRWESYYAEQGLFIGFVERVVQRLNASIVAADGTGATQAASLLESLMRELPATLTLDASLTELQGLAPDSMFQAWSLTTGAPTVESALERLKGFCASHPDPNVQQFGASIATRVWHGKPVEQPAAPEARLPLSQRLLGGLQSLAVHMVARARRVHLPSFWDAATMVIMFVLVNGGLIALQMSQSYSQNETFGSLTDYMSLLLWGYAGDATRVTLSDLAAKAMPGKGAATADKGGGATP